MDPGKLQLKTPIYRALSIIITVNISVKITTFTKYLSFYGNPYQIFWQNFV